MKGLLRNAKKMPFQLTQFSIVITAKSHNPTLINPDFLKMRDIVPHDFVLTETVTSEPISFVKFNNGISLFVQPDKLQISLSCKGKIPDEPFIPQIAQKYVSTLLHIRYTEVGINFQGHIEKDDPGIWIKKVFFKDIKLIDLNNDTVEAETKLSINKGDHIVNLIISNAKHGKSEIPAVFLDGNFHHELTSYPGDQAVVGIVEKWAERLSDYKSLCEEISKLEV